MGKRVIKVAYAKKPKKVRHKNNGRQDRVASRNGQHTDKFFLVGVNKAI